MLIKLSGEVHVNAEHIVLIEPYTYAQEGSNLRWTVEFVSGGIVRLTQEQYEELMAWVQVVNDSPAQSVALEFADTIGGSNG